MYVMDILGLPAPLGLLAALVTGGLLGLAIYALVTRPMLGSANFETQIFIATIGVGSVLQSAVLHLFGPQPKAQPLQIPGGLTLGGVTLPWQNVLIMGVTALMLAGVAWLLGRTRAGLAIRATAQNRVAAQLMGIRIGRVYAQVLMLSGALAAVSGVMVSSLSGLLPTMGADPMLKAFVICVVAGLGNVPGAALAALLLGVLEAVIQNLFGVRYAFAILLALVIAVLIWRPYGLFGTRQVVRQ